MTAQLDLDLPPRTHDGDPPSSHLAEARLRTSGRLNQQQQIVLELVVVCPGSTGTQVAERIAGSPYAPLFAAGQHERLCQVRKRLSDLYTMTPPRIRRESIKGKREVEWFIAGE